MSLRRPFHASYYLRNSNETNNNDGSSHDSDGEGSITISPLTDETLSADDEATLAESFADVPGTTNTKKKTLAIIYTCKVCDTRSAKQFTEHSYRHGVVLVRCPGCQNLHLIADRLGWFEDAEDDGKGGWDIEKAMERAGENVKAVTNEDVLEMTLDDFMGNSSRESTTTDK